MSATQTPSLRRRLLVGILVPMLVFVLINNLTLYRQALQAADTAYDRTLLASAKAIGELLEVSRDGGRTFVQSTLPYSALEAFEADNRSRMYFRVSGFDGEMVSGFDDLPPPTSGGGGDTVYAALVRFYDDTMRGEPVRMAVLLQPVAGLEGQGIATIQVAETLELRRAMARRLMTNTLWRQALLIAGIAAVVVWVVQRATRPVRELSQQLQGRAGDDLSPVRTADAPRELQPVIDATNTVMARLDQLLRHQKRFVRDASHQLRTPLAVLSAQVQSAQRGDVEPRQALREIGSTVERATELANQMLALAKVEQLRQEGMPPQTDWEPILRAVALDLAPLIAAKDLDFELAAESVTVRAHAWSLRELVRNLLHNAIQHTPAGGLLAIRLDRSAHQARLQIIDGGPGIDVHQRERLFQPFATTDPQSGSGLGLAICREIVQSAGGSIALDNRTDGAGSSGLAATVQLPLTDNRA
jgi:two-component system, OmpR family, sensor histidine kinase TctE